MIRKCKGCGVKNNADNLTLDGYCFDCDQGTQEGVPNQENMKELAESVVEGLADKKRMKVPDVAQEIANASFADHPERHVKFPEVHKKFPKKFLS